jgi:hypothetical protein
MKTVVLLAVSILVGGSIGLGIGFNLAMKSKNMLSAAMEYKAFDEPMKIVQMMKNNLKCRTFAWSRRQENRGFS